MKILVVLLLSLGLVACSTTLDTSPPVPGFVGVTWHLAEIQSMDDAVFKPGRDEELSVTFNADGTLSVVADCNRAMGRYEFTAPSGLVPGSLASTRALCPPPSLGEHFVRDLSFVRSFVLKDERLYLATMADGAILTFFKAKPSFDCANAEGLVENMICSDQRLADYDWELDELYAQLMRGLKGDVLHGVRAVQRGWIKGRNDCWKADDTHGCIVDEYRHRITALEIGVGRFMSPTPVLYDCPDGSVVSAYYFDETEIASAVVNRAADQAILYRVEAASGAKYLGRNVSLWTRGTGTSVTWGVDAGSQNCTVKQR